jgi:hypothetical protein
MEKYALFLIAAAADSRVRCVSLSCRLFTLLQSFQWLIAVAITYPAQFSCIFAAYLLVLDRMIDFTVPGAEGTARRCRFFGRVLLTISSLGSVVGFCTNVAASVIFEQSAQDFFSAQTTKSVSRARQDATWIKTGSEKGFCAGKTGMRRGATRGFGGCSSRQIRRFKSWVLRED